jgi:FkbM family methyltransferase
LPQRDRSSRHPAAAAAGDPRTIGRRLDDLAAGLARLAAEHAALRRTVEAVGGAAERVARRMPAPPIVATEVNGFIVGVPAEEWRLAAFHQFRGVLEPGLVRAFSASLRPGATVVDIGANLGLYTLIAARAVGMDGKVFSFEPTPQTWRLLKDNVQVNGLLETGIVELRQAAVTDRAGWASLTVYRDNSGHNTLFPAEVAGETTEVETLALDAALDGARPVDVVKIDAEGAEPLIWRGMGKTLRRNRRIRVFMEFAPSLLLRAGSDPAEFLEQLTADGFRIQRVHDDSGELIDASLEELRAVFSVNLMLTWRTPHEG